jgi:hypothetical protein
MTERRRIELELEIIEHLLAGNQAKDFKLPKDNEEREYAEEVIFDWLVEDLIKNKKTHN